jgi:hypothetical protein
MKIKFKFKSIPINMNGVSAGLIPAIANCFSTLNLAGVSYSSYKIWRVQPLNHSKSTIAPGMRREMIKEKNSYCFRDHTISKRPQQSRPPSWQECDRGDQNSW